MKSAPFSLQFAYFSSLQTICTHQKTTPNDCLWDNRVSSVGINVQTRARQLALILPKIHPENLTA